MLRKPGVLALRTRLLAAVEGTFPEVGRCNSKFGCRRRQPATSVPPGVAASPTQIGVIFQHRALEIRGGRAEGATAAPDFLVLLGPQGSVDIQHGRRKPDRGTVMCNEPAERRPRMALVLASSAP